MMYVGTSLGGCLLSLMAKEVSEDEVMFIATRTLCPTYETFINVVKQYHSDGNPYARNPAQYGLSDYPLDDVIDLASRLYYAGRIHQPRVFAAEGNSGAYAHPTKYGHGLWMQVVPTNQSANSAVIDAWEKYKILDALTK